MGPNVKKLLAHRISLVLVPPGTPDPHGAAMSGLCSKDKLVVATKKASVWVAENLARVKACKDNPYGDDDEAIAGAILQLIQKRIKEQDDARNRASGAHPGIHRGSG